MAALGHFQYDLGTKQSIESCRFFSSLACQVYGTKDKAVPSFIVTIYKPVQKPNFLESA